VTNYVVQPQDWDERGKGVKNDRIDAQALCQRLDRYVRCNLKAFSVVRVPTAEAGKRGVPEA
jgi:transposase